MIWLKEITTKKDLNNEEGGLSRINRDSLFIGSVSEENIVSIHRESGQKRSWRGGGVSIQAESGQKRSAGRKMCLDTGGIGTEKVLRQKDVSRYRENRDRKDLPAERCVSIQRKSGQKRSPQEKPHHTHVIIENQNLK